MAEKIYITQKAQKDLQAYLEYDQLVGDRKGEKLLSEKEYDKFKKELQQKQKDRLFVTWRNTKDYECKYVGPATKCFCNHRMKDHEYYLNPKNKDTKNVFCKVKGCSCQCFYYIPTHGSYDFKCLCKHSFKEHDPVTKKCKRLQCHGCVRGFSSTWSCSCGLQFNDHRTIVETKGERIQNGRTVDDQFALGQQVQAYGGIQKFSDMIDYEDGYNKQIDNMISQPDKSFAPNGYKKMQPIQTHDEQIMQDQQIDPNQLQQAQKKKNLLANLNKKLKQEKYIDQYNHTEIQQYQEDGYSNYHNQNQDYNQNKNINIQPQNKYQDLEKERQEGYLRQFNQKVDINQGGQSAYELFYKPHQFKRVNQKLYLYKNDEY